MDERMIKQAAIFSTLWVAASAVLLTAPLAAKVTHPKDGVGRLGDYAVGPWTGGCARDGWLNGAEHESCGAQLKTPVRAIYLVRTIQGLSITLNVSKCAKGVFKAKMSPKELAAKGRAVKLQSVLGGLAQMEGRQCRNFKTSPAPIFLADLRDILDETDGLDF